MILENSRSSFLCVGCEVSRAESVCSPHQLPATPRWPWLPSPDHRLPLPSRLFAGVFPSRVPRAQVGWGIWLLEFQAGARLGVGPWDTGEIPLDAQYPCPSAPATRSSRTPRLSTPFWGPEKVGIEGRVETGNSQLSSAFPILLPSSHYSFNKHSPSPSAWCSAWPRRYPVVVSWHQHPGPGLMGLTGLPESDDAWSSSILETAQPAPPHVSPPPQTDQPPHPTALRQVFPVLQFMQTVVLKRPPCPTSISRPRPLPLGRGRHPSPLMQGLATPLTQPHRVKAWAQMLTTWWFSAPASMWATPTPGRGRVPTSHRLSCAFTWTLLFVVVSFRVFFKESFPVT